MLPFTYSSPSEAPAGDRLFPVKYRIPGPLRPRLKGRRVAVVNDVIGAGSAVRGTLDDLRACGAKPMVIGALAVVGDYADKMAEENEVPLETLARIKSGIWAPNECPLCARDVPPPPPGARGGGRRAGRRDELGVTLPGRPRDEHDPRPDHGHRRHHRAAARRSAAGVADPLPRSRPAMEAAATPGLITALIARLFRAKPPRHAGGTRRTCHCRRPKAGRWTSTRRGTASTSCSPAGRKAAMRRRASCCTADARWAMWTWATVRPAR